MVPHNRRRIVWALTLSVIAHLLFLAAYARMADWYRVQGLRPTRYLPDLLLLAPDLFRQKPIGRIPERLMEQRRRRRPANRYACRHSIWRRRRWPWWNRRLRTIFCGCRGSARRCSCRSRTWRIFP